MNRILLKKALDDAKWLLLGCGLVITAFCWVRVWLVSRLDTARFQNILDNIPDTWKRFASVDFEWLITYAGRIAVTFDEPIVVFGVSIWAIARGSDCISGEIGRGTMEMLLAQPVSRLQLLVSHATVTLAGVLLLASAAWLGIYGGLHTNAVKQEVTPSWSMPFPLPLIGKEIPKPFAKPQQQSTPMSELVDARVFIPGAANVFSLGVFLAGLTTLASSCDRYRWRTIGVVVSLYVVEIIVKIIARGVDYLSWLQYGSVFSAYEPQRLVQMADRDAGAAWKLLLFDNQGAFESLGPLGHHLILIGLGVACYVAAGVIFIRRDLPAPL
ncbi:MAG: ABC transporter permease subunit [Pirellulaceae bacterium]